MKRQLQRSKTQIRSMPVADLAAAVSRHWALPWCPSHATLIFYSLGQHKCVQSLDSCQWSRLMDYKTIPWFTRRCNSSLTTVYSLGYRIPTISHDQRVAIYHIANYQVLFPSHPMAVLYLVPTDSSIMADLWCCTVLLGNLMSDLGTV